MDQQQNQMIPKKFCLHFQSEVSRNNALAKTSQQAPYFNEIYLNSFQLEKNQPLIQNKLAEIGVSEEKSINTVLAWLKDMHEFYQKFNQLMESQKLGNISDHNEQKVADWKFELFIHKKYLMNKLHAEFMDKEFNLEINDATNLYLKLAKINSIIQFELFKEQVSPILIQMTDFDDNSQVKQNKILRAFYHRNLCIETLKSTKIENLFENNTLEICLDVLYGNIQKLNLETIDPLKIPEQTQEKFSTRLTTFLNSLSSKFEDWKDSKKKQLVSNLFKQVPNYDYESIINVLIGSKLKQFGSKELITDELLMKIFNLPSADHFRRERKPVNDSGKKSNAKQEDFDELNFNSNKKSSSKFQDKNNNSNNKKYQQQKQSPSKIKQQKQEIQNLRGKKTLQQQSIKRLEKQIKIIKFQTKNKSCIEIVLRELQIALLEENQKLINEKAQNLRNLVNKYRLRTNCFSDIDQVQVQVKSFTDRLPKVSTIRKKLYVINLIDVLEGKNYIENERATMCKDANAILIIGRTGAGKSTLMTALAGFKLIKSSETGDYRAENLEIAKQIPISNRQQSQTRWANVKRLSKIYSNNKDIIIIDTPGFQDNRGVQIEITNNIATINLIKKLASARILIVLPKQQFYGARQIQNYTKFIKLFSAYFFNVKDFQYSINIVLTKGLTGKQLLKTIGQIEITQTYRNIDWNQNEKNFQNILKRKLKELRRQNEIVEPPNHSFDSLMEGVIELQQKQSPGDDICQSFSPTALQALSETYNYLEKMVKETFKEGDFTLTSFYLNSVKELDSIQKTNNYHQIKNFLKEEMQKKVKSFYSTFKKFISSNNDEWLNELSQLRQYFYNPQSDLIYKLLYYNQLTNTSDRNPKQIFDSEIQTKIDAIRQIFEKAQSIDNNKKMEIRSTLKMMKSFGFNLQYQEINSNIINSSIKIHKRLENILDENEFNKNQWQKNVNLEINQFKENQDLHCTDIQKYSTIIKIVQKYIENNNQLDQIMKLKEKAMTQCLQGKLKKICVQYLEKLNAIKETNYSIKEVVEPKFKQILHHLDILIADYEKKQSNETTISLADFDMWENFNENRTQIFQIKAKFADSQVLQHNNLKQQESMLKKFFNNLLQNIDSLQKTITSIPKNAQHINPDEIHEKLETIFQLLSAMQRKKSASNGQVKNQEKDRRQLFLNKTLDKSYDKIKSIINSIDRTCSLELIRNFEINLKLMNSLTVILDFQQFKQKISQQDTKTKLDAILDSIELKIESPLKNIQNDEFTTLFSFEKLWNVLHYMKKLDGQTRLLGGKAINFQYNVNFSQNQRIIITVSKCLQKIKSDNELLKPIRELSTYGVRSSIKVTQNLQNQKKQHIGKLQYQLLQDAIKYIKSFKFIQKINKDFSEDLTIVQDFKRQFLEKLNLKAIVKSRIQSINSQLSKKLSLDYLKQIAQQFNFFNKIHQNTKTQDQIEYIDIENKIEQKMRNFGKSFDSLYIEACQLYQDVQNKGRGVDYSTLKELLDNPGRQVEEGEQKLISLLSKIDRKYENILTKYYIEQSPNGKVSNNANIFLNIIEFKKICQQTTYKCKLQEDLHKSGLQNLFSQVTNGFQTLLDDIKKGILIDQQEINMLIKYQKRIALLLKKQYDEFKTKKGITENYFVSFDKRKKEIIEQVVGRYSKKETLQFNETFLEIYQNTSPQMKQTIKRVAISKNQEEVQQKKNLINSNHQDFLKFYSTKLEEGRNMPQQIFQRLMSDLKPLINQVVQIQDANRVTAEQAVQNKKPANIIVCFLKGDSLNNQNIRKTAVQAIETYFKEEQETLDFSNLQNLDVNLQRNFNLTSNEDYKKVAQKNEQLNKASFKFVQVAKTKFQQRTNVYDRQVNEFKELMKKRKLGQSFQLSDTKMKPQEYQVLSKGVQTYKIVQKHQNHFVEEIDNFKKLVSERINQGNKELKQSVSKLERIKQQIVEKKISSPQTVISTLEESHSRRILGDTFYEVFNKIENLNTKVQQQDLQNYDTALNDIKTDLKRKYDESVNWNLQKFIENQMIVCNSKENEQNEKVLQMLDTYMPIFFEQGQFPTSISKSIQSNTHQEFQLFQKSVLEDIDNFFNPSIQCSSQKVMKYYKLMNKIKQSPSSRFSQNMKVDNKVKDKLLSKFKLNINQINAFIEKSQKLQKYNQFLNKLKKIDQSQKLTIEDLQKKSNIKIIEQCRKIQIKIDSQKSAVSAQDPDISTKIAKLDDQCKADKLSKENDLKKALEKNINELKASNTKNKQKITNEINDYLNSQIINQLILFKRAITYFYCEKQIKQTPYSVESFCKQIQQKYKKTIFRYMYSILKNMDNKHAQSLTNQKCFEAMTQSNWRDLVSGSTFQTLMKNVPHLDAIPKKQKFFDDRFKKFQQVYEQLTETYKKAFDFNETKKKLVEDTKIMGQKIGETYASDQTCKHHRWELLSRIAAIWTIHRSSFDDDNCVQFIHKPHPGQILATFLLLQFDQKSINSQLKNTMVQVSTGQGKSVILGILSTYLALVGFKVYEACYSNYLSQRDYKDFESLFELFGVKDKIFYKTFPEICRMMLQQSPDKPFIGKIQKLLINPSIWTNIGNFLSDIFPGAKRGRMVLLIDEADAFLDENYLGESFFPSINIKKKSVQNLLDFVWGYRQKYHQLTPQIIIKSKQFEALCKQMSNKQFRSLMENQSHAMVRDLGNYKEDVYSLIDGEIFYKTGDSLTNKIHYGYRTVFNYYHEYYVNKRISKDQFEKHISINLIIASFSYSKLPSYFSSILGVTGTLDCMSVKQKKILTDRFDVKSTFVQPSIYQPNRRQVAFFKCSQDRLFQQIAFNIEQQLRNRRPIVVFFQSKNKVYDFYNSPQFSMFKKNATIVTHEVNAEDRTFRINASTDDSKITLLTVDFSRGTDFKLNVKDADKHPGLHVICAFVPKSFSDYLQVVGRTGRQGKKGTVNLYFVDYTLAESKMVKLKQDDAEKMIKQIDSDHWDKKYEQLTERMNRSDREHEMSTALYSQGSSADKIFKQMQIFNLEYPLVNTVSRTVIGLDATCSMGTVFEKLISVIQTSLPIIRLVIQEAKVRASFQIKFVIYRNYNSKAEDLLGYSNFQSKTQILAQWLKKISVSGGWGNQALEVCLHYINSLEQVNQYVIISDAKGNLPDEVNLKRQKIHGQSYFDRNGFPSTTVGQEVEKLAKRDIKGHFYYLNPYSTESYYKKVVQKTGGIAQQFPIDDKNSSKIFGDFIAERILQNIGSLLGGNNAQNLIQRYKARSQ